MHLVDFCPIILSSSASKLRCYCAIYLRSARLTRTIYGPAPLLSGIRWNSHALFGRRSRQWLRRHRAREPVHGAAYRNIERIRLRPDDFGLPLEQFDDCRQPVFGQTRS